MEMNSISIGKRVLTTQLTSALLAGISIVHIEILINNQWLFDNIKVFLLSVFILITIFTVIIKLFLDGKWINIVLVSIPFLLYWFIALICGSYIFASNSDSEDYGVGIIILMTSIFQWGGVIIAGIVSLVLNKCFKSGNL